MGKTNIITRTQPACSLQGCFTFLSKSISLYHGPQHTPRRAQDVKHFHNPSIGELHQRWPKRMGTNNPFPQVFKGLFWHTITPEAQYGMSLALILIFTQALSFVL